MSPNSDPTSPPDKQDATHIESINTGKAQNDNILDAEILAYASSRPITIDAATNKRLRHQIDRRILPIMITTYFLQALDKGTLSFSSIMGLREDTHLQGQEYSWLTTCIYIAVLVVEYPTNWIIQRVPVAKYLGASVCIWGIVLALHAVCTGFAGLVTVRTLLGIFEACCQPILVICSGMWYKREEQASIVTYWYMMNGGQQIVGGLLAYAFSLIDNTTGASLKSWQALFLTYGSISFLWGLFILYWMPDSPMRARCFTESDKKLMVERIRSNQTGIQNRTFRMYQVYEALRDPQAWCYCAIQVFTTLPTSGLGAFANIIINGLDFDVLQTQLLAMVLGAYIMGVLLGSAWLVKKTGENLVVMLGFILPSFVGTIVLMTVVNKNTATKAGLLLSYYITLSFWSAQTLALSMVSRNIAGATKKSTVVAMTFISWAVGNAIGPQVFLDNDAPRYFIAFGVHLGCYTVMTGCVIFLRFWLVRQNQIKEGILRARAESEQEQADDGFVHAFDDRTDGENLHFRYIY